MNAESALLMDSLRSATWEQHKKLEKQPFNIALVNARLPQAAYIAQLQQYFLILQALEQAFDTSQHQSLAQVWQEDLHKTHLLQQDLEFFQAFQKLQILSASQDFIHKIHQLKQNSPLGLLGILYVFEGSTLGATVLLPLIRKTYALDQEGCAFYQAYGSATREHWLMFRERMNVTVSDTSQHILVTQTAQYCFIQVTKLLDKIWSITQS